MARVRTRNDASYHQIRNTTAKSARDNQQKYWSEIAISIGKATNVGDISKLYQIIGRLSYFVGDMNGDFIVDNSAKVDRWHEHFDHLLSCDEQLVTPSHPSAAEFHPSPTYAKLCDPTRGRSCRYKTEYAQQQGTRIERYSHRNLQDLCRHTGTLAP
ncbi:unnamed protein product [Schistocephalus solidus]|uniref:Gag-pol polyprotein n=1 Tax=Schistocephalus solidus TaxID=70667 RepID=A0A183SHT6_SCHSO|nr:unnamed protein product [Schistocephalus solidus]